MSDILCRWFLGGYKIMDKAIINNECRIKLTKDIHKCHKRNMLQAYFFDYAHFLAAIFAGISSTLILILDKYADNGAQILSIIDRESLKFIVTILGLVSGAALSIMKFEKKAEIHKKTRDALNHLRWQTLNDGFDFNEIINKLREIQDNHRRGWL
jgi:hypothetical protein